MPYLILAACGLLAVQEPLRAWLARRNGARPANAGPSVILVVVPVVLAAVYGGYFGAGLSVIVLAVLALTLNDSLVRLNALKQGVAFSVNIAAAAFFLFSGQVHWPVAGVMAVGALDRRFGGGAPGRTGGPGDAAARGGQRGRRRGPRVSGSIVIRLARPALR